MGALILDTYKPTELFISATELRELIDADETPTDAVQTCAGEWRPEKGGWRFYQDPEWED